MDTPIKTEIKTLRKPYLVRLEKGLMYSFPIIFIGFYFFIYWNCLEAPKFYHLNTSNFWKGVAAITGIMGMSVGYALYVLFKWRRLSKTFEQTQDKTPLIEYRAAFLKDQKSEDGNPALNGFGLVIAGGFIYAYYSDLLVKYNTSYIPSTSFLFSITIYLLYFGVIWFIMNLFFVHQTQEELKTLLKELDTEIVTPTECLS